METEKENFDRIKEALLKAFAIDGFTVYNQFVTRKLRTGGAVDVYLAELHRLYPILGGLPGRTNACAFVSGLPEEVRQMLRSSSCMHDFTTIQILARARAVMIKKSDEGTNKKSSAAAIKSIKTKRWIDSRLQKDQSRSVSYECKLPYHFARDCQLRRDNSNLSIAK